MEVHQGDRLKEFYRLYRETDEIYGDIAWKMGLSDSVFSILYDICELGDGCLQKDICKMSCISKQTINSAIQKLKRDGFLVLKPGRKRDMHIFLTEKGQELVKKTIVPVLKMENSVFEEMSEEESRQLIALTQKYVKEFRKKAELLLQQKD